MTVKDAVTVVAERIGTLEKQLIIAIDGRCAAGKTTLAEQLREKLGCNIIHADSFFPRPEQRTAERMNEPGGNLDRERLITEVMLPLSRGEAFFYRPFNCAAQSLSEEIHVKPNAITIIEGSYSCHPKLWDYYGLRMFLTVAPEEQLRRIERRNGTDALPIFRERWIPLEEKYFAELHIAERCDIVIDTTSTILS